MTGSKIQSELPGHLTNDAVINDAVINDAVADALFEDLGQGGDITTVAVVSDSARASALLVARERGVVSGLSIACATFKAVDPAIVFSAVVRDGDLVEAGGVLARVTGSARGILTGERVALNFMGRLCGIATLTDAYVQQIAGTNARIVDTRKTTPGLRALEKYAVKCGGGHNHRFGLFDAMMIKDNHIVAAGGIENAISRARDAAGHMVRIEVEVDTLAQLDEVLRHVEKIDAVLLDNMDVETLVRAVLKVSGRLLCEASGGVSLETVAGIARTGVDVISVGALTHSARALDLGLDFKADAGWL